MQLYMSVDCLDALVSATGFTLDNVDVKYKYHWLLERISMLRVEAERGNILHDNPEKADLVTLVQRERRWNDGVQATLAALQAEVEKLRIQ